MRRFAVISLFMSLALLTTETSAADFSFSAYVTREQMTSYARSTLKLGTSRDAVRTIFVHQGKARQYTHPEQKGVEKYVYDINLCRLYVWRWNISANYDSSGRLTQIFVNGEPVHRNGDALPTPESRARAGVEQGLLRGNLPRPQADRGEKSLGFIVYDMNTNSNAKSDEFVIGAGPSRADPANLGQLYMYNTELWRSIFASETPKVVNYQGKCP